MLLLRSKTVVVELLLLLVLLSLLLLYLNLHPRPLHHPAQLQKSHPIFEKKMILFAQEVSLVHDNGDNNDVAVNFSLKNIMDKRCNTIMFMCDTNNRKYPQMCRKHEYVVGVLTEILGARSTAVASLKAMSLATASLGSNNTTTQKLLFSPVNQVNDSPRAREVVLVSKDTVSANEEIRRRDSMDRVGLAASDRLIRAASKNKTIKKDQERKNDFNFFLISNKSCLDTIRSAVLELSSRHGKPDVSMSLHVIKGRDVRFSSFRNTVDMLSCLSNKFKGLLKNIILRYNLFSFSFSSRHTKLPNGAFFWVDPYGRHEQASFGHLIFQFPVHGQEHYHIIIYNNISFLADGIVVLTVAGCVEEVLEDIRGVFKHGGVVEERFRRRYIYRVCGHGCRSGHHNYNYNGLCPDRH